MLIIIFYFSLFFNFSKKGEGREEEMNKTNRKREKSVSSFPFILNTKIKYSCLDVVQPRQCKQFKLFIHKLMVS